MVAAVWVLVPKGHPGVDARPSRDLAGSLGHAVVHEDPATEVDDRHHQDEEDDDDQGEFDEGLASLAQLHRAQLVYGNTSVRRPCRLASLPSAGLCRSRVGEVVAEAAEVGPDADLTVTECPAPVERDGARPASDERRAREGHIRPADWSCSAATVNDSPERRRGADRCGRRRRRSGRGGGAGRRGGARRGRRRGGGWESASASGLESASSRHGRRRAAAIVGGR